MNDDDKRPDAESPRETQAALPGVPTQNPPASEHPARAVKAVEPEFPDNAPVPGQLPLPMPAAPEDLPSFPPQELTTGMAISAPSADSDSVAPTTDPGGSIPMTETAWEGAPLYLELPPAPDPAPSPVSSEPPPSPLPESTPPPERAPTSTPEQPPAPAPAWSFFRLHPVVPTPSGMEPSLGSRVFDVIARAPWLVLILMIAAQTVFSLDARSLWFSDEVRHADAFRNLLEHGRGIVLELNGQEYWDKPPLYFWFLRGLYEALRVEGPLLYFTGAAVSALLYLLSFLLLGRFVDRADGRSLLASGIVLFCGGYVYALMHYARMDFLFSACIVCSYVALYHALIRPRAFGFSLLAFVLGGTACLIKGPLGLALPLAAGFFFVIWRGKPLRLIRLDILLGLLAACAVIGAWVFLVYQEQGSLDALVREVWHKQILARAGNSFAHKEPFWYYLRLPLLLLPFSLVLFCLPWTRLFSRAVVERFRILRRPEGEGRAFLWCIALSALVLLSCLSGKILIYYLPALPAVALIAGRAVLELSGFRAALFRGLTALCLVLAGLGLLGVSLVLFGAVPAPAGLGLPAWRIDGSAAFYVVAFGLVAAGLFLFLVLRNSRPESVLLFCALFLTVLSYPLARDVAPAFDAVLSPKDQSLVMKSWMDRGYLPFSYKNYPGIYAYYADAPVRDIESLAELPSLPGKDGIVLAIRRKDLDNWSGRPHCLQEVDARYIEHPERVLLVCPPAPPAQEGMSPGREATPSVQDTALPARETELPTPSVAPSGQERTPTGQGGTPPTQESAPVDRQDAPVQPAPPEAAPALPGPAKAAPERSGESPPAPRPRDVPPMLPAVTPQAAPVRPGGEAPAPRPRDVPAMLPVVSPQAAPERAGEGAHAPLPGDMQPMLPALPSEAAPGRTEDAVPAPLPGGAPAVVPPLSEAAPAPEHGNVPVLEEYPAGN